MRWHSDRRPCRRKADEIQNTIYHLEPNIKEAPGGFRDLHAVRWLLMLEPREGTRTYGVRSFPFRHPPPAA